MMLKYITRNILTSAIVAFMMAAPATSAAKPNDSARQAVVRARMDTLQATMGDRVWLRVEVLKSGQSGVFVDLPKQEPNQIAQIAGVEVRDITIDSTKLQNGRTQINYGFLLQPFEPGTVTFPRFRYAIDADTFSSEIVSLKVIEPPIPQVMVDSLIINPMEGTVSIPSQWYDYIPTWWYWVVLGIILVGLGIVIAVLYRRNGPTLLPRKTVIPPYNLAIMQLDRLKSRKLAENGHEKEYYTELTDILRQYLEGRFGVFAREMSTTQILEALNENAEISAYAEILRPMLETSDFVKFAKVKPLPDENTRSYNTVRTFVETTKPIEKEPENAKKSKN